jgi:hypothetical protein
MKLGEILIQLGMLSAEQLNAVLNEGPLQGGKLGTRLVDLGLLDTDQVTEALGRQMGVPAALQRHFDRADPTVVAMLKPNLSARYMAIPLVAARTGIKRIVVAMATPLDVLAVDDVAFALGARVEPMVASELAIAANLKRFHHIDLHLSRLRSPNPTESAAAPSPRRDTPAPHGAIAQPASVRWVADALPQTFPSTSVLEATVGLEDAIHRLSVAQHREQLADILIDFMLPRFGCGLIFLLRGGNARVWRGFAPGVDARAIETIGFPIAMPSLFRTAQERGATFRGAPPLEGVHLQSQIWKYLRCDVPTEVVAVPIAIRERIVNLVYAHAREGGRLADTHVDELQAICAAVAASFVRLIRQAKEDQPSESSLH